MTWQSPGREIEERLTDLQPLRVLYELDGPQIFICQDVHGDLLLAYQCDEKPTLARFLLVPFDDELERQLTSGQITIREALKQPRAWLVDVLNDWTISATRRVSLDDIPSDNLPRHDAMLWPELQPVLSIRAKGDAITHDLLLGSVIQETVKRAEEAMEKLTTHVGKRLGMSAEKIRQLWDLPTQRFAFGSFEISFRAPSLPPDNADDSELTQEDVQAVYSKVSALLRVGLTVADDEENVATTNADQEERLAILEAAKALSPTGHGKIESIDVFGTLVGRTETTKAVLGKRTHSYASKAIQELKKKPTPDPRVQFHGRIIQITEKMPREFVLAKRDNEERVTFMFDDEHKALWTDAADAIKQGTEVIVSGIRHPKQVKVFVTSILPAHR